jgi:hypothetical protein
MPELNQEDMPEDLKSNDKEKGSRNYRYNKI